LLDKVKMNRINELARKQKAEGLLEPEKEEQHALRQEYLAKFREHFRGHLENIEVVDTPEEAEAAMKRHSNERKS
jgi:uncharacterized protein YnzC (UPF0291/DUF896 family)